MEFLTLEDLLLITRALGAGPVRDPGLLESAVARPRASLFGDDAYPTLELKAAALLHSICRNDGLIDGNKRLAWAATVTFLRANGHPGRWSQEFAFDLTMAVAEGALDVPEIAARLAT